MRKVGLKPKRYSCFTSEQQESYNKLPVRQRTYIDYRGQGYNKTQAYKMAGFVGKSANQGAYLMEKRNKQIEELVGIIVNNYKAKSVLKEDSEINKTIDALAEQKGAEQALEVIEGADGETARRIQFYRDIVTGKIKTIRKTKKYNAMGELTETKVEEVSDIDTRVKARKELDRILGLNAVIDLDKLQMGDITINIVDASKKEELEDVRNQVDLDIDKTEVIDGECVVVAEETEEHTKASKSEEFFESVGANDD